jgi:hypothetical protein
MKTSYRLLFVDFDNIVPITKELADAILLTGRFSFFDNDPEHTIYFNQINVPKEILEYDFMFFVKRKILWISNDGIEIDITVGIEEINKHLNVDKK